MKMMITVEDIPEETAFYKETGRNSFCIEYSDIEPMSLIIENTIDSNNTARIIPGYHASIDFDVRPTSDLKSSNQIWKMIIPK